VDYLNFFSQYLDGIKQSYGDEYIAKCPFHEDSKPSFGFNVAKGAWICRTGCGEGGVKAFKEKMGIVDTKVYNTQPGFAPVQEFKLVGESWATLMYAYQDYFLSKFMEPAKKKYGWDKDVIMDCLVGYDMKKQCLVFGIHDIKGRLVNIKWHKKHGIKGHNGNTIYPMYRFAKYDLRKPLLVVEGEKDVITTLSQGHQAICLTAGCMSKVPRQYVEVLRKFEEINIMYDNDEAGVNGSFKLLEQLKDG
tara:strand:+ start:533 stop:1276 length:744 start_codon:yes stop_codon:yes gene_type:complete